MTRSERLVLTFLANARQLEPASRFVRRDIERATGLTYEQTNRACRSLAEQGLVKFERSVWDWEGKMVSGGYHALAAGVI